MFKDLKDTITHKKKKFRIADLFHSVSVRKYVLIGSINSVSGYIIGVLIFNFFYSLLGVVLVSILSNFISILFSFINYKFFFFNKSFSNIIYEFFKFYLIYTIVILSSILQLYIFIEILSINIYSAQALIIIINLFILFFSHFYLIFKGNSF